MKLDGEKREAEASAQGFLSRRAGVGFCVLLLALAALQMLSVIRRKSITVDEWVMIPAGYYHLTAGDYRAVSEHPPFAKVIAAAPLLLLDVQSPPIDARPHDYEYFLDKFWDFWHANDKRFDRLSFWARVPAIVVTILLGALVFVFARRHWGERAALFAVALFTLEPTVLAHGRVVQTDIPSALAFLLFSFAFYAYLKAPDARRAVYAGLAVGFAAVTKFSMIALAPVIAVALVALFALAPRRGLKRRAVAGHTVALAFAAVLAVNAAYFFHHSRPEPLDDALARSVVPARLSETMHAPIDAAYYALQVVFPADFVNGIGWQLGHAHNGHPAGLLGQYSRHGWWYYFPVAFALKTPLPVLLLSLAGVAWALLRLRRGVEGRVLVLLLPLAFFTGLLMLSTINIGVRYYLPAYPFFFILAAERAASGAARSARGGLALLWLDGGRGRARLPRPHDLHEPARVARAALVVPVGLERRVGRRRARPRAILARARRARGRRGYPVLASARNVRRRGRGSFRAAGRAARRRALRRHRRELPERLDRARRLRQRRRANGVGARQLLRPIPTPHAGEDFRRLDLPLQDEIVLSF